MSEGRAPLRRTPWTRLVLIAVVAAAVVLAVLRMAESRGVTVLPAPVISVLVLLGIAAVVLAAGWNVRQYRAGRRPGLDPLVAARTVVLATASAYTGSLLAGWYAAHVVLVAGDLAIEARRDVAVAGGVALLAAVVLVVAGLVVERWCEIRADDDEDDGRGAEGSPA